MASKIPSQFVSTLASVALCACATSISNAAWAQGHTVANGMSASKPMPKISRNDHKPQQIAKVARPAPQSLRYLVSEAP
ncbi:hypothetical protein F4827_003447 [Paraburkholderia bannensis]|uniref:Lipoprotein n=1 Tax=Paraburkholderia bannensis TaxID=765414 RepID=A0A7W9TY76_9BURK|nr:MULTISPECIES: hypothetical protein [Paraburkholderia]MBB3258579.1 hypothetical protein [Paraburkholderia sp. WP4_3_2]MBB6103592.1 hypothetical protein [Paraburkholderia bannensis]